MMECLSPALLISMYQQSQADAHRNSLATGGRLDTRSRDVLCRSETPSPLHCSGEVQGSEVWNLLLAATSSWPLGLSACMPTCQLSANLSLLAGTGSDMNAIRNRKCNTGVLANNITQDQLRQW
jgi:hypothetical protein